MQRGQENRTGAAGARVRRHGKRGKRKTGRSGPAEATEPEQPGLVADSVCCSPMQPGWSGGETSPAVPFKKLAKTGPMYEA